MKMTKFLIAGLSIAFFLTFNQSVSHAANDNTDVTILITEPELYIESVTPPMFDTYQYSKTGYKASPKNDLSINVVDKREVRSAWTLSYSVGLFEKGNKESLGTFSFSKGKLLSNDQEVDASLYEASTLKSETGNESQQAIVTLSNSSNLNYEYVVDKKDIVLEVPAKAEIGKYYSKEVITLTSSPDYE